MGRALVVSSSVFVLLASGAAGCVAPSSAGETTSDEEVRVARCESRYAAPLRAKVSHARERLERKATATAVKVRETLDSGGATVLPFCAMTRSDFDQLAKDTDLSEGGATLEDQYARLREGDESIMRSVHRQIYGYQWEDRVYLASTMSEALTLETLAHEVEHVLRRAHLRNYDDQRVVCVEELAAARAERLVHVDVLTPDEERALLDRVQDLYELDKLAPGHCGYR